MGNYLKSCGENQSLSHSILLQLLSFTHKAAWLNLNSVFDCFGNEEYNFAMRWNLISWETLDKDKAYQNGFWSQPSPTWFDFKDFLRAVIKLHAGLEHARNIEETFRAACPKPRCVSVLARTLLTAHEWFSWWEKSPFRGQDRPFLKEQMEPYRAGEFPGQLTSLQSYSIDCEDTSDGERPLMIIKGCFWWLPGGRAVIWDISKLAAFLRKTTVGLKVVLRQLFRQ